MRPTAPVSTFALVVTVIAPAGCGGSAATLPDTVCSELYGRGLTGGTEHCRPFGVLDFGVIERADGTVAWTCECMPGAGLGKEEPSPEEEGSGGTPPESLGAPEKHVSVVAGNREIGSNHPVPLLTW
jgi:hypothetical protein